MAASNPGASLSRTIRLVIAVLTLVKLRERR